MNFDQTCILCLRLGAKYVLIIIGAILVALIYRFITPDSAIRNGVDRLLLVLAFALIAAIAVVWVKTKQGVVAYQQGEKMSATVLRIERVNHDPDASDDHEVIWRDKHGRSDESLPRPLAAFSHLSEGDHIVVYAGPHSQTWWEEDLAQRERRRRA